MKIVFHEKYLPSYDDTPAGESSRLEPTLAILQKDSLYEFIKPEPAPIESVKLAHSDRHIEEVKNSYYGKNLFDISLLAAGGAIMCGEIASKGEPAFGLIRPPGHHASEDSCWGFCYFNNVAVSLFHIKNKYKIKSACILDFDLHTGDGNINILGGMNEYTIINPGAPTEIEYLADIKRTLDNIKSTEIIVASAGFDQGIADWGGLLSPDSYYKIGELMKSFSESICSGRRYALLEGGYNFKEMAKSVKAFCEGFRD